MTIKELFEQMPQYANSAALKGVTKTVQFNVSGDDAGSYILRVADGDVTTEEGEVAAPDITITTPADVWMDISTGKLNGAVAYMTGRFKAQGDLSTLMAMPNWFSLPG